MLSAACRFDYLIFTDSSHFLYCCFFILQTFFYLSGGLCAWWKRNFDICRTYDEDFGGTTRAATFDENFREKRLAAHEDPEHPFTVFDTDGITITNYSNYVKVFQEELKLCCGLRSGKEPAALVRSNFTWFIVQEGHFKGCKAVVLKPTHGGQKGKALTLKNHTAKETLKNVQHLPILKGTGLFDCYKLLDLMCHKYMPPDTHIKGLPRIFRLEASVQTIKVRHYFYSIVLVVLLIVLLCCFDIIFLTFHSLLF